MKRAIAANRSAVAAWDDDIYDQR